MKPFLPGASAEPLEPKGKYQLVVTFVKNIRGECTFTPAHALHVSCCVKRGE